MKNYKQKLLRPAETKIVFLINLRFMSWNCNDNLGSALPQHAGEVWRVSHHSVPRKTIILNPGGGNPVHNCVGSLARHIDANLGAREVSGLGLLLG